MKKYFLFLFFLSNLSHSQSITENDWQTAFNNNLIHGKLEYNTLLGRADILSDEYVIEVDYVRNYREGIKQALQYAGETGRKPGVALIVDGTGDSFYNLVQAKILCNKEKVKFWLVNEFVSISQLVSRKNIVTTPSPSSDKNYLNNLFPDDQTTQSAPVVSPKRSLNSQKQIRQAERNYWLNTKSGVRHNSSCRWYGNTKNGRPCGPTEGRPCGTCGG